MSLFRALHAELLKLKRTLAFRVIFVLPFFVALLQFFVIWRTKKFPAGFDLWQTHPTNSFQIWAIFMLPLLITLEDCTPERHRTLRQTVETYSCAAGAAPCCVSLEIHRGAGIDPREHLDSRFVDDIGRCRGDLLET